MRRRRRRRREGGEAVVVKVRVRTAERWFLV